MSLPIESILNTPHRWKISNNNNNKKNYKPDSGFEHLVYWGKLEMKTTIAIAAAYKIVICCIKQASFHT